jgi:hypothetical protein
MTNHRKQISPVLVDQTLNWAFAVKYFIYAIFGLAGAIVSFPGVTALAGSLVATTLGAIIALSATVAGFSTLRAGTSKRAEMWEFYSTVTLVAFILVYISSIVYLATLGDHNRIALAVIASALVVLPCWKLSWIIRKNGPR